MFEWVWSQIGTVSFLERFIENRIKTTKPHQIDGVCQRSGPGFQPGVKWHITILSPEGAT